MNHGTKKAHHKVAKGERKVKTIKDTAIVVHLHNEKSLQFRSQIVICCNEEPTKTPDFL